MDEAAFPWSRTWYREKVAASLGPERMEDRYRLWYVDHAMHTGRRTDARHGRRRHHPGPARPAWSATSACSSRRSATSPRGWSTTCRRRPAPPIEVVDGQVRRAAHRPGAQGHPGGGRPDGQRLRRGRVAVGDEVRFDALVEVPFGAGADRVGRVGLRGRPPSTRCRGGPRRRGATAYASSATHTLHRGRAPTSRRVRVTTQRQGDVGTPHAGSEPRTGPRRRAMSEERVGSPLHVVRGAFAGLTEGQRWTVGLVAAVTVLFLGFGLRRAPIVLQPFAAGAHAGRGHAGAGRRGRRAGWRRPRRWRPGAARRPRATATAAPGRQPRRPRGCDAGAGRAARGRRRRRRRRRSRGSPRSSPTCPAPGWSSATPPPRRCAAPAPVGGSSSPVRASAPTCASA